MNIGVKKMITKIFSDGFYDECEENHTSKIPNIVLLYMHDSISHVCYGIENEDFILRSFYMKDDNNIYLSKNAIGDIVKAKDNNIYKAIKKYNEEHMSIDNNIFAVITRESWKINKNLWKYINHYENFEYGMVIQSQMSNLSYK